MCYLIPEQQRTNFTQGGLHRKVTFEDFTSITLLNHLILREVGNIITLGTDSYQDIKPPSYLLREPDLPWGGNTASSKSPFSRLFCRQLCPIKWKQRSFG